MRLARGCRLIAAAPLFLSGLVGCAGAVERPIDPDLAEKVVVNAPNRASARAAESGDRQARAEANLQAAEAAWRSGDALTALSYANHALLEGVPRELDGALRELRAKARAAVVATKICRVRTIPDKDVVSDGEPVGVRIEFANLASTRLSVPRAQKGSSDALVVLTLVREDLDVYGDSRRTEFTLSVPVRQDLVLEPGRSQDTRLVVPPEMARLSHEGFSVIELSGVFRPVVMRVGESEFFDAIPIERARIRIFQKGFEPLAADPLGSLKKAVARRSPPHLFAAAELLAPSERAEAKSFLEDAKAKDPDMADFIDASLARIVAPR